MGIQATSVNGGNYGINVGSITSNKGTGIFVSKSITNSITGILATSITDSAVGI